MSDGRYDEVQTNENAPRPAIDNNFPLKIPALAYRLVQKLDDELDRTCKLSVP